MESKPSKWKIPHVFIFLFGIVLFCVLLTYLIPSGSFDYEQRTYGKITQNVVVPGSYKSIPKHLSFQAALLGETVQGKATPVSFMGLLTSIPKGLQQSASLIFFVFIVGGIFNIIHRTGAITGLLFYFIEKFKNAPVWLLFLIYMVLFSGSAFMGIVLETIALIPVLLLLSKQMGYDRIFGISLILIPVLVGWSTGVTNPFTVQIAQQIAELPIGSGIGMRVLLYFVCAFIGFYFLMRYGKKVKKDPTKSIMKNDAFELSESGSSDNKSLNKRQLILLCVVVVAYAMILYAVQTMGWGFIEMSGGFIGIGILVIFIYRMTGDDAMEALIQGLSTMIIPALVVGVARAISVVLQEGMIIDTILYHASNGLSNLPLVLAGEGMLLFQSLLNFFIPSASGQALVSMPLMTPMADLLDISRQTAVLAFILGDGLSNLIIPTNGVLMAMLGIAGVPFEKWFRFILPCFIVLMIVAVGFIMLAILTGY